MITYQNCYNLFIASNGYEFIPYLISTRYTSKTVYLYFSYKPEPNPYPRNLLLKLESVNKKYSEKPAPSISVLKNELGLDDPVPHAFTHNGQRNGIVLLTAPMKLLMLNADGKLVCQTGSATPLFLYRGQNTIFDSRYQNGIKPCIPTVFRCKTKEECLLLLKRTVQFERKLDEFDEVKEWQNKSIMGNKFYVNKTAIAQHYGYATNLLDLTSDFDIAAFFATTRFKDNEFHACREGVGVIYVSYSASFMLNDPMQLEIIGMQPIPRSDLQSAFALKMKRNEDLNNYNFVYRLLFKQRGINSKLYLNRFKNGKGLFPQDDISKKIIKIKKLIDKQTEFSGEISKEAELRYSKYFNE